MSYKAFLFALVCSRLLSFTLLGISEFLSSDIE